jgi:hexokinase
LCLSQCLAIDAGGTNLRAKTSVLTCDGQGEGRERPAFHVSLQAKPVRKNRPQEPGDPHCA